VIVLFGVAARFGISTYPLGDAVALGLHDFAAWVLAGLAVAWKVKPARAAVTVPSKGDSR
jgi:hypothetical protein